MPFGPCPTATRIIPGVGGRSNPVSQASCASPGFRWPMTIAANTGYGNGGSFDVLRTGPGTDDTP